MERRVHKSGPDQARGFARAGSEEPGFAFITGMARSGTTLLEKILSNHPSVSMLAQPFPLLYTAAKTKFLESIGIHGEPFPLSNYFQEARYRPDQLVPFLSRLQFTEDEVADLFARMSDYSGQMTDLSSIERILGEVESWQFHDLVKSLLMGLAHRTGASVFGSKEIYAEEFLPFLLKQGHRCVVIVRDPRDVIASLNYGRGRLYGGLIKPALFHIRNWRRSVAFMIECRRSEHFLALRYEDFVERPHQAFQDICAWLAVELPADDLLAGGIRDQAGEVWQGNSSHDLREFVSAKSVGAFGDLLPDNAVKYIEACCAPEMRYLGYEPVFEPDPDDRVFRDFCEPVAVEREEFRADFSSSDSAVVAEATRRRLVDQQISDVDVRRFFVFESVYRAFAMNSTIG